VTESRDDLDTLRAQYNNFLEEYKTLTEEHRKLQVNLKN
jgi:hypothetical protein